MSINRNNDYHKFMLQLDSFFQKYLVDVFPVSLSDSLQEFVVKIFPIFSLLSAIILVPFLFTSLGLSALFAPLRFLFHLAEPINNVFSLITWLLSAISLFFWLKAIPGLFNRTKNGWVYSYYNVLLNFISHLILGNISINLIITIFYLFTLYQVKNKYQNYD